MNDEGLFRVCIVQVYQVPESSVFALNAAGHVEGDQTCCPVACWDVLRPASSAQLSEPDVPLMISKQLLLSCEGDMWSLPALIRSDFTRQSVCVPVTPDDTHPFNTRCACACVRPGVCGWRVWRVVV